MAARRLLIIMLVLLGISSAIAIAVPKPDRDDSNSPSSTTTGGAGSTAGAGSTGETGLSGEAGEASTSGTTGEAGSPGAGGEDDKSHGTAAAGQAAGPEPITVDLDADRTREIKADAGSRVILTVRSNAGSEVEVEGLGLSGFADPYAPAVFDVILPREPGKYAVRAPGKKPVASINTGP